MKLGVDVRVLGKGRALSRYTKNILNSIGSSYPDTDFYLFTDDASKTEILGLKTEKTTTIKIAPRTTLKDHFLFKKQVEKYPIDVLLHPDNTEYLFCFNPSVVVIHDLIPWLHPDLVLSTNPILNIRQRIYLKLQEKALRMSASKILTVSNTSKEDMIRYLGIDPDKITVTYEGIDENFKPVKDESILKSVTSKYSLPDDYILYIGGLDERKNIIRLVQAFAKVAERHKIFLVIGGKIDSSDVEGRNSFMSVKKEIEKMGLSSLVVFTGFVDEADLPALYSKARIFVYPSFYEGFGLPPLEAMSCGTPVICSNTSSMPEICGDAAMFVNPFETKEFFSAIDIFIKDKSLCDKYVQKGFLRSQKYSWQSAAQKTFNALSHI